MAKVPKPTIAAYHFLREDMTAGCGSESPWKIGETRTIANSEDIKICEFGYHSCPSLWDALYWAPGPVACLVQVSRPVACDGNSAVGDCKQVSASRTLIKAINIDRKLLSFAADCAERVLPIFEKTHPLDDRPRRSIQAARALTTGQIETAVARAAGTAAWDAAGTAKGAAARDAARATAWGVAQVTAGAAVRATASYAEVAVAGAIAGTIARDAAGTAAWAAAWATARVPELQWQHTYFNKVFKDLFKD